MARHAIGIDISDASIEVVEVSDGGQPSAVALGRVELPSGLVARGRVLEPEKLAKEIAAAMAGARPEAVAGRQVVVNIPESQLFTAWTRTSVRDEELPAEALRTARSAFPFALEDLVVDFITVRGPTGARDLFVVAVPWEVYLPLSKAVQAAGLSVSAFDIESRALVRAFGIAPPAGEAAVILDIGTRTTIVSLHDAEGLRATVNVPVGGATLSEVLAAKLKLSPEKAEEKKRQGGFLPAEDEGKVFLVLQSEIQPLIREAAAIISEEEKRLGVKVSSITLAGGSALLPGMAEYLQSVFDRPVSVGAIAASLPGRARVADQIIYANAVGLALRGLRPAADGLSFLRKMGTLETAARPVETRPQAPKPALPKAGGGVAGIIRARRKIIAVVLVALWIAGLIFGTIWFMRRRTAELNGPIQTPGPGAPSGAETRSVQFTAIVAVKPGAESGAIPGTLLEATRSANKEVVPAEKRTEDAQASGSVILRNTTGRPQTLVATTRLLASGGALFRLRDRAVVPAGGQAAAQVYADQAGVGGNIGPSRFTIPGLAPALQDKIYAESSEDMKGGVRDVSFLTEVEIQRTLNALREEIIAAALETWKTTLDGGVILVPEPVSYAIASSELPETGAGLVSPQVRVTARVRGLSVEKAALEAAARTALDLPAEEAAAWSFDGWVFSVIQYEEDAGSVTLNATVRATKE